MSNKTNTTQLLAVAREAARAAGQQARHMFSETLQVTSKGPRDIVTDADIAAQQIITDAILHTYPDHGFLAEEENAALRAEGPILWVIDPIDGTTNFSRGVPVFCVSIAAMRNEPPFTVNDVLAGVVYDPIRDEMFTATAAGPALLEDAGLHGRPLRTSSVGALGDALVAVDWAHEEELRQLGIDFTHASANKVAALRSFGSATLAMAWLAAGRLDAYVNFQLKPWDVAAAALLVKQAGGTVTDVAGSPLLFDPAGFNCLLTNGLLGSAFSSDK